MTHVAWQYLVIDFMKDWRGENDLHTVIAERLNELGSDGWEVCGFTCTNANYFVYTLKRPLVR